MTRALIPALVVNGQCCRDFFPSRVFWRKCCPLEAQSPKLLLHCLPFSSQAASAVVTVVSAASSLPDTCQDCSDPACSAWPLTPFLSVPAPPAEQCSGPVHCCGRRGRPCGPVLLLILSESLGEPSRAFSHFFFVSNLSLQS